MTPKEKAKELVEKFYGLPTGNTNHCVDWFTAIESALVTVDEILNVIEDNCLEYDDNYWQKVKQEIEKL